MIVTPATRGDAPTTASATGTATGAGAGDLQVFLRLLTAQIRNQDPLKPIESTDFAVQLATFSGVEQQVRTNQLLEQLAGGGGIGGMAGWIGREARVEAPAAYSGLPVPVWTETAPGADRAVLVALDAGGRPVLRQEIAPGPGLVEWTGTDQSGTGLPPGLYRFQIESYAGEERIAIAPAEIYARITEVRGGPDGPEIVLDSGAVVKAGDVSALR